jgi:hypothetical protein
MNWKEHGRKRLWRNRDIFFKIFLKGLMTSVMIASVRTEFRTEHFPSRSLDYYCCSNPFPTLEVVTPGSHPRDWNIQRRRPKRRICYIHTGHFISQVMSYTCVPRFTIHWFSERIEI